jgi:hypothetical protein
MMLFRSLRTHTTKQFCLSIKWLSSMEGESIPCLIFSETLVV